MGEEWEGLNLLETHFTRFWVHSRSRFVSRATLMPSEKFERAPFRRRWARACSSMSSLCLALRWPELFFMSVSHQTRQCNETALPISRTTMLAILGRKREQCEDTYVCACLTNPLSKGVGSNVSCMRSFRTSTTSTPEYDPLLDS